MILKLFISLLLIFGTCAYGSEKLSEEFQQKLDAITLDCKIRGKESTIDAINKATNKEIFIESLFLQLQKRYSDVKTDLIAFLKKELEKKKKEDKKKEAEKRHQQLITLITQPKDENKTASATQPIASAAMEPSKQVAFSAAINSIRYNPSQKLRNFNASIQSTTSTQQSTASSSLTLLRQGSGGQVVPALRSFNVGESSSEGAYRTTDSSQPIVPQSKARVKKLKPSKKLQNSGDIEPQPMQTPVKDHTKINYTLIPSRGPATHVGAEHISAYSMAELAKKDNERLFRSIAAHRETAAQYAAEEKAKIEKKKEKRAAKREKDRRKKEMAQAVAEIDDRSQSNENNPDSHVKINVIQAVEITAALNDINEKEWAEVKPKAELRAAAQARTKDKKAQARKQRKQWYAQRNKALRNLINS